MSRFHRLIDLIKARVPDVYTLDREVGTQRGVTPGGTYKDQDGHQWYMKYHNTDHEMYSEHLANAVYRATGAAAPHTLIVRHGSGTPAYASKYEPNFETLTQTMARVNRHMPVWAGHSHETAKKFLGHFAVDAFLGTHDHHSSNVGTVTGANGEVVPSRIDNGYAATKSSYARVHVAGYRHTDAHDGALQHLGMDHKKSLMGNRELLAAGIKRLDAVRTKHGGWQRFVDRHVPTADRGYRQEVAQLFERRHGELRHLHDHLKAGGTLENYDRGQKEGAGPIRPAATTRPDAFTKPVPDEFTRPTWKPVPQSPGSEGVRSFLS